MSNKHRYIANSVFLPALTLLVSCLFSVSIFLKNADAAQSFSSQKHDFYLDEIASGFDTPWGLAFVTPNKLILTERDGDIFLLDLKAKNQKQVSGHPKIESSGQGGLLDVALPSVKPENYQDKIRLYFTYSKSTEAGLATTLASAELVGQHLINWQDILVTQSANDNTRHFGSRITFDGQGHLFFSIGDRAERDNAQNLSNHAGAIIRLTLDGKTPADNPFVDSKEALAEIWSYGHRNPQGLVFDKTHKRLWSIEHGPRGGDEINLIEKGKNYGWPFVSQGKEYWGPISVGEEKMPGMQAAKKVYTPSIAPGGLTLYQGKAFPKWQGSLFSGAMKLKHLNRVEIDENGHITSEERLLESLEQRIRAVITGPDGYLYFSSDNGKIYRLRPQNTG